MIKIRLILLFCLAIALNSSILNAQTYSALPFNETFESAWVNKDGTRDVPSSYWKNTPATGSNSWSRNDDGVARGAWTGVNFWANNPAAANGSSHSASFASGEAYGNGTLDLYVDFSTLAGPKALYFWYINTSGNDKLEVSVSTDGGTTFGSALTTVYVKSDWTKISVDLGNLTSTTGVIKFKAINLIDGSNPISIDDIYVGAHSTTPVVADFSTDLLSGIAPLTVNFTDKSTGDVTGWSWDYNNDGTIDATTQNYNYIYNTEGTFTASLTASKPGFTNTKTTTITVSPQVYASLPFIENFDHDWVNREGIKDVPTLFFKNSPSKGDNSWRRDDTGDAWTGISPSVDYTPAGARNSPHSARFHSGTTKLSGTLDAFIDFSTQTGNKTLSFWYINPYGTDKLEISLSVDGGVTFGAVLITKFIEKQWIKVIYDLGNITSSKGVIRFKATGNNNGIDIGLDDVRVSNPTQIPIDANFTSDKTSGQGTLTVNFTDQSGGVPTSWEWDFNNDGVIDATTQNPSYTYTSTGIYTVKLKVGNSNYTDEIILTNYIVVTGYATLPYYETFESSWVNRDDVRDVPNNFWKGTPATGNNSWSRQDDGLYRGAWITDYGLYKPRGANGSLHSACFDSNDARDFSGSLDLFLNLSSQTGEKRLSFWYINRDGSDKLELFLSTDGGSTFGTAIKTLGVSSFWTKVSINLGNINSATSVIRFKATSVVHEVSNVGIDDVNVVVPTLLPLKAEFSQNTLCGNSPLTVNFVDMSEGAPTSWEWDFNNDGVIDATTQNPTYTFNAPGCYTVKLTAINNSTRAAEIKKNYIVVTGYASLPFVETFDSVWVNRDALRDVPSAFCKNTPASGSDAWSRDDDGVARGAWYSNEYAYTPAGANGTSHSARNKHAYGCSLDFYIDFSTMPGEKSLTFWYLNSAIGQIDVYLSTDGGATFGSSIITKSYITSWTKYTVSLGNVNSPTCVVRFKETDSGNGYIGQDMGIDEISINYVDADFSSDKTTGPSSSTIKFTDLSAGAPTSWKWDFNNDGVIDATDKNPSYTFTTPGKYTVKLISLNSGSSDTIIKKDFITIKPIYYAKLPYNQNFDSAWINLDQTRDVPSYNWTNSPATGSNSWSRDDDGVNRGAWSYNGGSYTPAGANGSLHSARFHSNSTSLCNIFDLLVDFSSLAGNKNLRFWYFKKSSNDSLQVLLSTDGGSTFSSLNKLDVTTSWVKVNIPLGYVNSPIGVIRFKAKGSYSSYDIGLDEIKISTIDADFAANILTSATPGNITFTDQSFGKPVSWKWDFNNDGVTDATNQNPEYTYSASGKYTVKLIVLDSAFSDTIVKKNYIDIKPIYYAKLPYSQNFDSTWVNLDQTRDVPSYNWINNPATGKEAWSRDDDGVNRGAWTNQYGDYSPAGANGSTHSARFHSYQTSGSNNFDLLLDFSSLPGDKALYFWYINTSGTDSLKVLLSSDRGVTFTNLMSLGTKSTWTKIAIDLKNSNSNSSIIRFKVKGDFSGDIGIDNIFVGTPSTTPIITAFQVNNTSGIVPCKFDFKDQSTGDVTSWKWDFNNDGIIESTLQNPSYTYTTPGNYSIKLIASKSGMSDSIIRTDFISVSSQLYAPVPFKEGFDKTWINRDNTRDVPSNYFLNNPSSGNNSWTRFDDASRTWSTYYNPFVYSGALNTPACARFNSYGSNLKSGILDLFIDFSTQFSVQQLSFWYLNTSGTDKLEIYLSRDGGATFGSAIKTLGVATTWTKVDIDLGFIAVYKGVIRFMATGDGITSDIGIDEIVVCDKANTPVQTNFSNDISTGSIPLIVNFTDQSIGTPTFWNWDFNNDRIIDATTQNPSFTYNTPGVYAVKLISGNSDNKDSITKTNYIVVPGYASLPFTENFENDWVSRDGFRDVPSCYYKCNPAKGSNSWSRSDDGELRWGSTYGGYNPAGANGSLKSARFHSYATISNGIMDLFVDFSTLAGDKTLSFWYINTSGTDSLFVFLSSDGGATNGTILDTFAVASNWTNYSINLGNVNSTTGVIRFKAKGDDGYSDIGLDDINIGTTGKAVNSTFTVSKTIGIAPLSVKFTDQSSGSPISWKWDFNNDGKVDSTSQNPSFVYTNAGKYSVSLEVSGTGSTDKETKIEYIIVCDSVKANYTADRTDGFAPLSVYFTNKTTGTPTTWKWDFNNDGVTDATTENPNYCFTQPGSYSVKLIVSNPASSDTIIKNLFIRVKGKASLPYSEDFEKDWKSYQSLRDVPSFNWINSPSKAMYSWSRDDDGVARGAWNSNNAAYSPAGANGSLHSARFHTYGFMNSYISSFYLNVDFSTLKGDKTLSFYYINPGGTDNLEVYLSTDGGKTFGTAISTQNISASWSKVNIDLGNVTSADGVILFKVTADLDQSDIGIDELSIYTTGVTPITAKFSTDKTTGFTPLTVKFKDESTGTPTLWKWDFNNDGIIDSTTQNPSFKFTKAGVYSVTLFASKPGFADSEFTNIIVEDPVDALFTQDNSNGIAPLTVSFTDNSTGNPTSWKWDFNSDGVIDATTQNPTHTFNAGSYYVKLIVSKNNSIDSITKYFYFEPAVIAKFSADNTVAFVNSSINFTDLSTGNPTSWSWDFNNDGVVDATAKNPSYTYSSIGTYTVSLTSSKTGSYDVKMEINYITIIDSIDADFTADVVSGKAPLTVNFTDKSIGNPETWKWDFANDGTYESSIQNPTYVFTTSGTYTVKLTIGKSGKADSETKTAYIIVSPPDGLNNENLTEPIVTIYPVPANNWVTIKLENFENEKIKTEIVDINGAVVSNIDLTGTKTLDFDFSGYARGIYYLKTYSKNRVIVNKMVLQ